MPEAPESSTKLIVALLYGATLLLFKEVKVGSIFVVSVIKLQDSKTEPTTQFFLFLCTWSLPPDLLLAEAVATCPSLGNLHDFESWFPTPWVQQ